MVPGLFASVTRQTILWSLDCLEGRFDFDLYDGGPLRLTLFLGGFLDRFARLERFLFFNNKFLFRFLGFRECRFGRLDTMAFSPTGQSLRTRMVLLGWCYYSSNGSVYKAIVTTLQVGSRFGGRKGGFESKNLEGSSFNPSTPWVFVFKIVLLCKILELNVTCSMLLGPPLNPLEPP